MKNHRVWTYYLMDGQMVSKPYDQSLHFQEHEDHEWCGSSSRIIYLCFL